MDESTPKVPRFIRAYIDLAKRHPLILIAVYLVITALAIWPASNLKLVTDLGALLPEGTMSVRALDESNKRVGSTDMFTVAIESSDPHAIAAFQDALADTVINGNPDKKIEKWDDASWTQTGKPTDFFKDHALLYIPEEDLERLRDSLETYFQFQAASIGGFSLLDEEDEKEAERDLVNWYDPTLPDRLGLPGQIASELEGYFEDYTAEDAKKKPGPAEEEEEPSQIPKELRDRLMSPDAKNAVVLVRLARPSTDIDYAEMALNRGTETIEKLDPKSFAPDLRAEVVGGYRSFMEVQAIGNDAKLATSLSLGLVIVLFFAFFRRFRAIGVVILPLAMGCILMLGITGLTYGRLTSITAFVVAMLIGMGIDYGIHLYTRAVSEVRRGRDWSDALAISLSTTGRGLLAAAITTIASLLTLLAASFKGFFEYGIIASYGIAFCLLMSALMIPPMVFITERIWPSKYPPLPKNLAPDKLAGRPAKHFVYGGLVLAIVITASLAYFVPKVSFEHDFRNLRAPKTKQTIKYGKAVGKESSTTPDMILGSSQDEMRLVHEELLHRKLVIKDPRLKSFITIATFVPSADQQIARKALMTDIREILDRKAMKRIKDPKKKEMIAELRRMTDAEPFDEHDLPGWVVHMFEETDGSIGRLGYLYNEVNDWNAVEVMDYQDDYGSILGTDRDVPVASSSFILADVVRTVKSDASRLAIWIVAVILLIIVIDMRSLRGILAASLALAVGAVWTVGLMGLYDIRLGLYNIIVIPTVLGVAIDGAIHLVHSHTQLGNRNLGDVMRITGRGVLAASLTTAAGFTGLLFIKHKGLMTIGTMSVTGVLATMLAVALITPAICTLLERRTPHTTPTQKKQE